MTIFLSTLDQMAFLFLLIVIGYILTRLGVVDAAAPKLLSKLESNVFIPALVMSTFMSGFTVEHMRSAGQYILGGLAVILVTIPIAILTARLCAKDDYIRNIYTYGLAFSNFGFMGNAVVLALFPDIFMEYLIFVLPFWFFIYLWGVPALLIPADGERKTLRSRCRALVNPMFIGMLIGAVIGLIGVKIPTFLHSAVSTLGSCMSPVAMLLTGMTVAGVEMKRVLKTPSIYIVTAIRLILLPALALVAVWLIPMPYGVALCTVCTAAMPLGLNVIVIPSGYGKDTSIGAGMALVSHLVSCLTIPLIFWIFGMMTA